MTLNDLFQVPRYWGKLPESKSSGAYKLCFQYLIGYTIPGIPYDWSTLTVYFNTYANHLLSCCQILQTCRACETLLHRTFRRFDIWNFVTRNGFSRSGCIWVFEKMVKGCLLLSSYLFSPIRYFTACWLFFLVLTDPKSGTGLGLTSLLVLKVVFFFMLQHQTGQTGAVGLPVV